MLQTISRIAVIFLFLMVAQDCITDYYEHVKFIQQVPTPVSPPAGFC